jgi:hypothetical protein
MRKAVARRARLQHVAAFDQRETLVQRHLNKTKTYKVIESRKYAFLHT